VIFALFCFVLGVLAGAFVWVPVTIREAEKRFARQLEIARRYRQ
jgi:hypothetical protein